MTIGLYKIIELNKKLTSLLILFSMLWVGKEIISTNERNATCIYFIFEPMFETYRM